MRRKTKLQLLFAKKERSSVSTAQNMPSQTAIILSQWYRNINDLPLNKFIDCFIDDNLHALVISGNPAIEQLHESWQEIRIQYADAIKDHDYVAFARLSADILRLEIFQDQVKMLVEQLRDRYVVQFHDALNKLMNYKFVFDVTRPGEYDKELQKAINRSKGQLIDLNLKRMTLESMLKKMAEKGELQPTREYFQSVLITLSDHAEYKLRADDMTVFEYCERIRRLNAYIESIKKK